MKKSACLGILAAALSLPAAPAVEFESEIRPLLEERCVECHGPDKQKGGLRLDLKSSAFQAGDSGERGIVPGKPRESWLFHLVSTSDDEKRMPPKGEPLTSPQLDLLSRWISEGAPWTETPLKGPVRSEMRVTEADRQHWSFRPVQAVTLPEVKDTAWGRTPVDRFIRQAQEKKALPPTEPAAAEVLIRRLYFDVIGLPPKPEEMKHWSARLGEVPGDKAVAELVDTLLASEHYGERWARHWLDVARYADSSGQESDHDRPMAYHFRDFVIRALNEDMPYHQFVRWQLAGDEFEPDNPQAIAATGFIVAGNSTLLNVPMEEEKLRNRANELDDMVSTTGQAFLGLTLACARCHDHKYDPVPSRDYYRLMRVFNGGDRTEVPLATQSRVKAYRAAMAAWQPKYNAAEKERDDWLKKAGQPLTKRIREGKIEKLPIHEDQKRLLREKPQDEAAKALESRYRKELKIENADYVSALPAEDKPRWKELDGRVRSIESQKPPALPTAFAFADFAPEPRETWFFERGNFLAREEKMDLGFLTILTNGKSPATYWEEARQVRRREDSTQQRKALAEWITDLDHGSGALLARVMVNRVWQHHFGEGLVRTAGDFGTRGEEPTHPELLEWLTGEFIQKGWSLKHLHRLMLTSAAYRQGSVWNAANAKADPENRLVWRFQPQRLESEILRDTMLAVAGSLNSTMYGPSFKPPIPAEAMQARNVKSPYPKDAMDSEETRRRTVYMFHKRVVQYPLMQAFDAPDAQVSCSQRMNTTVAPQALALLNDPFVRLRARELAGRLEASAPDAEGRIRLAFQLCLNREASPEDLADALGFVENQTKERSQRDGKEAAREALADFCQSMFGLNEFIYVD